MIWNILWHYNIEVVGVDPVLKALKKHKNLPKKFPGTWLIVAPVHWEATHNNAVMVTGGDALNLSEEASRTLYTAFATFLAEDNMQLHYCNAGTWLLLCEDQKPPQTEGLHRVLHRSMHAQLSRLKKTPFWLRFLTESQMFFNGQKQGNSTYPVNGVWVWPAARSIQICSYFKLWRKRKHEN